MKHRIGLTQLIVLAAVVFSCLGGVAAASQVVVVVPTPGNAIQSGNDLLAAYNGITGANFSNRYLVVMEPGVYDLGNQNLVMQEWVSLAGSGVDATLLRGNGNPDAQTINRGLVEGADNAELRDLTIRVFPATGRQYLLPIYLPGAVSPRIHDLRTQAFGAEEYCGGIFGRGTESVIEDVEVFSACPGPAGAYGIVFQGEGVTANARTTVRRAQVRANSTAETGGFATGILVDPSGFYASHTIEDSTVSASGGRATGLEFRTKGTAGPLTATDSTFRATGSNAAGARIDTESATFRHSRFEAESESGTAVGISATAFPLTIENCLVSGATNTILGGIAFVGDSKLAGGPVSGSASNTCAGIYDENFTFFPSTCP